MIDLLSFAMVVQWNAWCSDLIFPKQSFIGRGVIALSTINIIVITYLSRNELTNLIHQEKYASSTHFSPNHPSKFTWYCKLYLDKG